MSFNKLCHVVLIALSINIVTGYFHRKNFDCGRYGFVCEDAGKVRLCLDESSSSPTFLCPAGTICNEDSSDVCQDVINYMDPAVRTVRCRRNERIADPSVPGCKGYILCIPNQDRFQGIKFKCTGNTVFNGFTRTCSASDRYKCPMSNSSKTSQHSFNGNRRHDYTLDFNFNSNKGQKTSPIDCKNYKLTVTQENSPSRAAYFCPPRPLSSELRVKCTVFSNHFCIILERDDEDQFVSNVGVAYRKPRREE